MPALNLPHLAIGERVQHEFLVYDRAEKRTTTGDPFVVLTLGNSTGKIDTAPVWSNQLEWVEGAESGRVVQAIGQVQLYGASGRSKRQLQLAGPVRALPSADYSLEQFLPRIGQDAERLWSKLDEFRAGIASLALRRALDCFYADGVFRERLERTPGSTAGHHAKLGGLLLHIFEVTNIARQSARTMRANVDLVVAGALLHDVGKVDAYTIGPGGFTYTPCGLLVGHVVLGALMLERRLAARATPACTPGQLLDLQHLILSHHGKLEHGSPVEPMTVEAEIVHWADEASAKATDMLEAFDDPDAFSSGSELSDRRSWRLGRRLWKRPHDWE